MTALHVAPARDLVREHAHALMWDFGLSDREIEVLEGMAEGLTNAEIGRGLFLSADTVKTHAWRLMRKLGVRSRAGAVAFGFRKGWLA